MMMKAILFAVTLLLAGRAEADSPAACAWPNCNPSGGPQIKSSASPVDMSLQDCTAGGICPNPRGAFLIDQWVGWAGAQGQNWDVDGSMWDSGTANAATDFIAYYTDNALGNTTTQWNRTFAGPANPNDGNGYPTGLCRDSVLFKPCGALYCRDSADSIALCSATPGTPTCTPTVTSSNAQLAIVYDASEDDYWPISVGAYTGCTASTTALTLRNGSPIATTTSDRIQMAVPDGIHPDVYYHRWLAQLVLNASEEFAFYPATNAIANGQAETSCAGGATWTETGAGALSQLAQDVTDGSGSPATLHAAGCQLGSRGAAADSLNTAQWTTVPGRVYVAKGWIANNSASATVIVEVFDQTPTVLPTANVAAWHILGGTPIALASETGSAAECYLGCYVVVKFQAHATQTGASVRVRTSGTEAITMDEWFAFPSPTQNMQLNPLIDDGLASIRLVSDSRANGTTSNEFGTAFDTMLASTRPNLATTQTINSRMDATSGRTLNAVANTEVFSSIRGTISDYTLIYLGVNDASGDRTPAQYAADMLATVREIRKTGSTPIILADPPYKGDTSSNTCGTSGTTNCALTISDYIRLITGDPDLY